MTRERFISEVRTYQGPLRRFLMSLCGDAALADDLAQEALVRAYVSSGRFIGNFKAWLFRIAYNGFIDHLRRNPAPAAGMDAPEVRIIADPASTDDEFRHEALRQALSRIPEKERTAVVLHYFEDLRIKDIATIMHLPAGTVKYHLSLGREHLKNLLNGFK